MSILLKTIQFFNGDEEDSTPYIVSDDEKTNIKMSMGNKGSGMEIIIKNAYGEHILDGEFRWKETDTVKVFLKYTDDPSYSIDTDATTDLIMVAEIEEFEAEIGEKITSWKLKIVDKTYILLNQLWAKAYTRNEVHDIDGDSKTGWTPPEIIRNIIRITTTDGKGSSEVKADFVSNGGYIQDTRPDSSSFDTLRDELSIAKVFKPVYEWIEDLSSIERTNTDAEQAGTLIAKRPYFFYVDENNNAHWEYPSTTSSNYEISVGATGPIGGDSIYHELNSGKLKKAIFDIVNMVIFNAGDDFNGNGILDYYYDPTTGSNKLKPVYKPMTDIAEKWKKLEIYRGLDVAPVDYTLNNDTGKLIRDGRKYDATYSFKPIWADASGDASIDNDNDLNESLRIQSSKEGKTRASEITQKRANPRWKGTISLKGYKYALGNLITFNDSFHGISDALIRITDIQHSINKGGWYTTLTVEEDAEEKTN